MYLMDKKFHLDYRKKRTIIFGFSILLLLMIYFFKSASFILRALSTIAIMLFFYFLDHTYDIRFKKRHYIYIFAIVILSFLASPLYFVYPQYDKIQHFIQPMLACSIIFMMINKLNLELKWKIVFTFFIVVAMLGLLEVGEFALDSLFNMKLQGVFLRDVGGLEKFNLLMDPLTDTMIDLVLGVIGTVIYLAIFAFYSRRKLYHKVFREV